MSGLVSRGALCFGKLMRTSTRSLLRQLRDADGAFIRWAARAVLTWNANAPPNVRVFQIHGSRDHVLPAKLTNPDQLIEGGGHLLPLTYPKQTNAFIEKAIIASQT